MAEGEFALVTEYLATASNIPVSARGLPFHDNEMYFMYVDLAVQQRDQVMLRRYVPLADQTASRDGHIPYQASAHRGWGVLHRLQGEYTAARARLN